MPVVPITVVSFCNIAMLWVASSLLRKRKKRGTSAAQKYLPHKQLIEAIASLEERVSATSVGLDDAIFKIVEMDSRGTDSGDGMIQRASDSAESLGGEA